MKSRLPLIQIKKFRSLGSVLGWAVGAAVLATLLLQVAESRKETRALQASLAAALNRPPPPLPPPLREAPIELADVMTKLQRHANKLYFSGKMENWKLADFYIEEIEETVKAISKKDIMDGQINVSGLMAGLILPEIEALENVVSKKDLPGFEKHYQALVTSCNACHEAAKRPYLVIELPRTPIFDNQRYAPVLPAVAPLASSAGATPDTLATSIHPREK